MIRGSDLRAVIQAGLPCPVCGREHQNGFEPLSGYEYLQPGDKLMDGDEYGPPTFKFVVSVAAAAIKHAAPAGVDVSDGLLAYHPRRKLKEESHAQT